MDNLLNTVADNLPEIVEAGKAILIIQGVIAVVIFTAAAAIIASVFQRVRREFREADEQFGQRKRGRRG